MPDDIAWNLSQLDPSLVGFVIALFVAALSSVLYLYLRNRKTDLWWRVKAAALSLLISGTAAAPFIYFLSTCTGYCGF